MPPNVWLWLGIKKTTSSFVSSVCFIEQPRCIDIVIYTLSYYWTIWYQNDRQVSFLYRLYSRNRTPLTNQRKRLYNNKSHSGILTRHCSFKLGQNYSTIQQYVWHIWEWIMTHYFYIYSYSHYTILKSLLKQCKNDHVLTPRYLTLFYSMSLT